MRTKAAVLYDYHQPLVIEEVKVEGPKKGEVLIKTAAAGVCHSDLFVMNKSCPMPMPIILGHEGAGTVVDVGKGVGALKPGDRVVLTWLPACRSCRYCITGRPILCDNIDYTLQGTMPDGTTRFKKGKKNIYHYLAVSSFSQYTIVPEAGAIPVPPEMPLDKAALVGCSVLTGIGAVLNTARITIGDSIAVIGAGGVGLNIIQGARLAGAQKIVAIDIHTEKLKKASLFGATHCVDSGKVDPMFALLELTGGRGVDYAFEAVGHENTLRLGYSIIRKGGKLIIIGVLPTGQEIRLPLYDISTSEKTIIGSRYGSARPHLDIPMVIELYLSGKIMLDELLSKTYTLDKTNQVFEDMLEGRIARGGIIYDDPLPACIPFPLEEKIKYAN